MDVNIMPSQWINLFISHFLHAMLIQALKKHPANWCVYSMWSFNWLLMLEEYGLRNRKTICYYYVQLQASGSFSVNSNYTFIYSLLQQTSTRRGQKEKKPKTSCKAAFVPTLTNWLAFSTAEVKCWGMSEQTKKHSEKAELHQAALFC